jgi:probable HAF family extracellular repeat protein
MGGNWALAWPAGAITLAFATTGAAQAPSYTFTTIDVPGATFTAARSINDASQIVGSFTDSAGTHGFVLSGGSFTTIDVQGASSTHGGKINTRGQIVGRFTDSAGTHGFVLSGGNFTTIDVPGATASFGTFASGVNDADQIVGDFFVATGQQHGFLDIGGTFTTIDVPGVLHSPAALDINNASRIVGYYDMKIGFLDAGGSFTTIDVPGSQSTYPFGINNNVPVQIVGWFGDTGLGQECTDRNRKPAHGFLDSGGSFTTIDVPGATQTCAYGINDLGQIVGSFTDSAGTHGFLASPDDGAGEGGFLGIGTRR